MATLVNFYPSDCMPSVLYQYPPGGYIEEPSTSDFSQKVFRTRTTVDPSNIDAENSSIRLGIFYDTFYDNLEPAFSQEEWDQSLLSQKIWLIHREYESGESEWILKIFSENKNGVIQWLEILSEERVKLAMKSHHVDTPQLPPTLYSIPLMRVRVARLAKSKDHWIDICGWIEDPIAIYAVSSTNITPHFSKFAEKATEVPPSKTKVMLYFLHHAAFKLAFPKDADDDMEKWIIYEENPAFSQYDKLLKLKDAAIAYSHTLPFDDEENFFPDSSDSSEDNS